MSATLDELRARCAELGSQLATLETEAEQANQAAGAAMAGGDSLAKVTADMEKAAAAVRLTRAALSVVDKQILQAIREEKAAKAGELKAETDRLDAEYLAAMIRYRAALIETGVAYKAGAGLSQQLMALQRAGAKSRFGGAPFLIVYADGIIYMLNTNLQRELTREELAPLGLQKPPTVLELGIADAERQLAQCEEKIAATIAKLKFVKEQGLDGTGQLEDMIAEVKRTRDTVAARLATLRGDAPAKLTAKDRQAALAKIDAGGS